MGTGPVLLRSPSQLDYRHDLGFTMEDASKVGERPARRQESREKGGSQRESSGFGAAGKVTSEAGKLK